MLYEEVGYDLWDWMNEPRFHECECCGRGIAEHVAKYLGFNVGYHWFCCDACKDNWLDEK